MAGDSLLYPCDHLIDGFLDLTVRLDDGDVHYHLHRDPLVQYALLTCNGATWVRYSAS
jgi:hypothetical protein